MEIKEFLKLSKAELLKAYNRLSKQASVIFTGSINPLINKLDHRKVALSSANLNY